jgi:hypothetical protein
MSTRLRWLLIAGPLAWGAASCSSSSTAPSSGGASSGGASSGGASSGGAASGGLPPTQGDERWKKAFSKDGVVLTCAMSEAEMLAKNAPNVSIGTSRIVVGFEQVGQNQNPIVARFDAGTQVFCERHETEGPDGRAVGITWDGGGVAYVVYTIVGGGSALDAKSKGQWLDRYGDGGGSSKVSVLGAVDAQTGALSFSTFVIAKKQDGKTNSHTPVDALTVRPDGSLEFRGSSAFQPMNPDRSIMTCTAYPFDTRYVFSADLKTLVCSTSTNCTSKVPCP